jgi:osmotically-inducible protein OsmY
MLWLLTLPVRLVYRLSRLLGLRRIGTLAVGVGVGLLLAPVPGAEMRERLRRRLEEAGLGVPAGDGEIAERVRRELSQSPSTWHLTQPQVEVVAGSVILSGEVPHTTARTDLERTAAAVPGVVAVDNRLVVSSQ